MELASPLSAAALNFSNASLKFLLLKAAYASLISLANALNEMLKRQALHATI